MEDGKSADWKEVILHISGGGSDLGSLGSAIITSFLGLSFAAVHVLAWNFSFPTERESDLWRAASIFTVLGGFFAHSIISMINRTLLGERLPHRGVGFAAIMVKTWDVLGYPLFLVYSISRCFLLFEAFYSLRSLPADTYDMVTWSQYIPHF